MIRTITRDGANHSIELSYPAWSGRLPESISPRSACHQVREPRAPYSAYESEGSERRSLGSVNVAADARWLASLTVPIATGDVVFVHVERRGALPAGYRGGKEAVAFSLPISEADALVDLLAGIVAQARQDGVLPGRK
jgi:hypothetical protein